MKPRVILDLAFLGHAHGIHRGTERVTRHLFEGLRASGACDLSYVATSHLAGVYDFLKSRGIDPERDLHFHRARLARSRIGRQLVSTIRRTLANRSAPARAGRKALATLAGACLRGERELAPEWLEGAAIYHSPHTPFPAAVRANARLRRLITVYDFIPLRFPENYPSGAEPFMGELLSCLQPENHALCISETTRRDVLSLSKMPPEQVFVTPLAADPAIFHPVTDPTRLGAMRAKFGLGDAPYFLALSAHDPHKNFPHLIECFGRLTETGDLTGYNFVIVGPNPGHQPAVRAAIARFPVAAPRILVPGFVPDEDLAALYSGSTAFLFPSIAEGFGIPPLEAMQCGVPVIASNTTAMPEVIGDAGLLLAPKDKDAWCEAILRVSRDARLRADLAGRSIERARLFSWQRFIDETLRAYQASLELS